MSETVYFVSRRGGGSRGHIHTDEDCKKLQRAGDYTDKPREVIDDDKICSVCSGEFEGPNHPDHDPSETRKRLLDTDPEELGLSPLGERNTPDEVVSDAE